MYIFYVHDEECQRKTDEEQVGEETHVCTTVQHDCRQYLRSHLF